MSTVHIKDEDRIGSEAKIKTGAVAATCTSCIRAALPTLGG